MGGSSSKEKSGAPKGGKNAYTYAKKLGRYFWGRHSVRGASFESILCFCLGLFFRVCDRCIFLYRVCVGFYSLSICLCLGTRCAGGKGD